MWCFINASFLQQRFISPVGLELKAVGIRDDLFMITSPSPILDLQYTVYPFSITLVSQLAEAMLMLDVKLPSQHSISHGTYVPDCPCACLITFGWHFLKTSYMYIVLIVIDLLLSSLFACFHRPYLSQHWMYCYVMWLWCRDAHTVILDLLFWRQDALVYEFTRKFFLHKFYRTYSWVVVHCQWQLLKTVWSGRSGCIWQVFS